MNQNTTKPDFFALYASILVVLVGLFVGVVSTVVRPATNALAGCPPIETTEELPLGQIADTPAPTEKRIRLEGACPEPETVALEKRAASSD